MNTDELMQILTEGVQSYSPEQILMVLLAALAGGLLIYFIYRVTTDGTVYDKVFNAGNVLLSLLTAVIMLMISSNIVISLGMVGALSIVRFRTAVKEARDTIFLFWAIVNGLCVGSQNYLLAVLSCVFIGTVAVLFSFTGRLGRESCVLIVRGQRDPQKRVEAILKTYAQNCKLRAAVSNDTGVELVYRVRISQSLRRELLSALRHAEDVTQVNLSEVQTV